jgi:hypothetical protein
MVTANQLSFAKTQSAPLLIAVDCLLGGEESNTLLP